VRFICGAQTLYRELEQAIAKHLAKRIRSNAACFDANGGVFEPLLDEQDAIIPEAQPRLDHRRRAAQQGQALPLRQFGHE
jgi:7-keto-8-aminopelargonate synthetase-like enzyme